MIATMNKIRTSLANNKDADLSLKVQFILDKMTGNPAFANPVPPLDDISIEYKKYSKYFMDSLNGGRLAVAKRESSRKKLQTLLTRLAAYVTFIAGGDRNILLSSGFDMAKTPEHATIPHLGKVTFKNGTSSGEIISMIKAVKNVRNYMHQILDHEPDENSKWLSYSCSTCKFVFKGLTPGKKYWVRIIAAGSRGQVAYSDITFWYCV